MDIKLLEPHLDAALAFLSQIAVNREDTPIGPRGREMTLLHSWRGALRGEYRTATRVWDSFCPCWHTGQAVKAFVLAARALDRPELLDEARFCAHFLVDNQIAEGEDAGMMPAYEDHPRKINTSAVLESLDGLFLLSEVTGEARWREAALAALGWVERRMWHGELKLFSDSYDPAARLVEPGRPGAPGRPLLDDAVFLSGWRHTGNEAWKKIALDTAEKLLETEQPSGNWIGYVPCRIQDDVIHPRHAFWWGMPMLEVFRATGDDRFRECFLRAVAWYRRALRADGGFMRETTSDFNSGCFEHATSGSACAALMFLRSARFTGDPALTAPAEKALSYCCRMQFTHPEDPELRGAILEKVLYPDGSDRLPYHIRDLGTIFFVQAAADYLLYMREQEQRP